MSGDVQGLLSVSELRRARIDEIVQRLRSAKHVLMTTHVNADGDGAGSETALAAWLESVGVRVTIVNPTPYPENFRFLLHRQGLTVDATDPSLPEIVAGVDLGLVVDTSEPRRIAPLEKFFARLPTIVVDHHPAGPAVISPDGIMDPEAAAAGELVYDILAASGDPWPFAALLGIYVAIVSDTGSFRFGNTTPRAHVIAAEMISRGVDPETVFEKIFATAPMRRLELLREALAHLHRDEKNGIAWIVVSREITDRLGSTLDDYDGLIEHVRSIEGTKVAIMFREAGSDETKISLRSSGSVDVNRIARKFGGGGHVKASGANVALPLGEAVKKVVEEVRKAVEEDA
ncbi:MAG: bifunctional oligoribonuclease/PAP phosphatase NrnA [Gemmatimonadota bacterium]|jgi:phosphoesterase RecJ-like protein|nr:bifunctional oligoribonuclease/PAP phosphatase NrnA [Gemmatimonadota bacterium]